MSEDRSGVNLVVLVMVAGFLGFLAITVPSFMSAGFPVVARGGSWQVMSYAVEHLQFLQSAVLLLAIGMVLGFVHSKKWWLLGLCMIAPFPVSMLVEILVAPRSHNLWPIEMMVYGVLLLPAWIGNLLGGVVRKHWEKSRRGSEAKP